MIPVVTGVSESGYTQVTLPAGTATTKVVVGGAYSLLAKLKNAEEEE